jgi:hypothetical protein
VNLSDAELILKVSNMPPDQLDEFLFPSRLIALLAEASSGGDGGGVGGRVLGGGGGDSGAAGAAGRGRPINPSSLSLSTQSLGIPPGSVSAQLPPARRHNPSSEPGMSGAWSDHELRTLVGAVKELKAASTGGALNWKHFCKVYLPYRTAIACQKRYYLYIRHKHEQNADDEDGDNGDDTDVRYYDPFREWATSPLAVDLAQASRVLESAESLAVCFLPHHHHHTHTRAISHTHSGFRSSHDADTPVVL